MIIFLKLIEEFMLLCNLKSKNEDKTKKKF